MYTTRIAIHLKSIWHADALGRPTLHMLMALLVVVVATRNGALAVSAPSSANLNQVYSSNVARTDALTNSFLSSTTSRNPLLLLMESKDLKSNDRPVVVVSPGTAPTTSIVQFGKKTRISYLSWATDRRSVLLFQGVGLPVLQAEYNFESGTFGKPNPIKLLPVPRQSNLLTSQDLKGTGFDWGDGEVLYRALKRNGIMAFDVRRGGCYIS